MISIITTCYNREAYLGQAIQSVLDQSYKDFELIIWDDGSTDNSVEVALRYARRDSRIKVTTAPHQGCVKSLVDAIARSTGNYFGCVDSDDYLMPACLAQTSKILDTSPDVGVVYTWYGQVDANDNLLGLGHRCYIPFSKDRMLTSHITFHFRLIRRSVYQAVGGIRERYEYASDYDLCLRLSEVTEFYQLQRLLYCYRNHPNNMTNTSNGKQAMYALQAINEALERRGLDYSYILNLANNED